MKIKNKFWLIAMVVVSLVMAGCSEDNTSAGITWDSSFSGTTELYSVVNQSSEVKFKAESSWKAGCSANWITFSPKSGEAGNQVITVATTSTNRTKNTRTAQLTIESGGSTKTVTIKQRGEYAFFEKDVYPMPAEGGNLTMGVSTNVTDLFWGWSSETEDIIPELIEKRASGARATRADRQGTLGPLKVVPNTNRNSREGHIFLTMKGDNQETLFLDTVTISQEGMYDGYFSVDYSEDGKYKIINQATIGKGIPIVLMGDGFQDREIADGYYEKVMSQAMENIFSEEPIRSLREYFNVYQVTAVSKHNVFGDKYSTALSAMPDATTTGISVDKKSVMNYVKKVQNIDSIRTLAVVILNTDQNKGVTYLQASSKITDYSYAIALCPVIDSLKSEMFRSVLVHEAVGHGFAKLADEYVRSAEGSATDDDIKELKERHEKIGWFLNVDSEKDSTKVLWTKFIYDTEFANEKIGTYEGGYTFFKGVYRPSEESMMRSNDAPFNAPSRQAIYNKVMKMALDKTPTYEDFVEFDKAHKPTTWKYRDRTRQSGGEIWRPAPPRIIWR